MWPPGPLRTASGAQAAVPCAHRPGARNAEGWFQETREGLRTVHKLHKLPVFYILPQCIPSK